MKYKANPYFSLPVFIITSFMNKFLIFRLQGMLEGALCNCYFNLLSLLSYK